MDSRLPLVSVVMATYNQAHIVRESLDSVLSQTYPNIQLVVGDDGSGDGTQEILKEYLAEYPGKITLILSPTNKGITKNVQQIRRACKGKYVAWTAGDDLMMPKKIEKQVEYMEVHPECSILYHDLDTFDSQTGKTLYKYNDRYPPRQGDISVLVKYGCFCGGPAVMTRSEKEPRHGHSNLVPRASDWLYWIDTLANGGEIHFQNEVLGRYRRHPGNVTGSNKIRIAFDHVVSITIIVWKYPHLVFLAIYRFFEGIRNFLRYQT